MYHNELISFSTEDTKYQTSWSFSTQLYFVKHSGYLYNLRGIITLYDSHQWFLKTSLPSFFSVHQNVTERKLRKIANSRNVFERLLHFYI